MKQGGLAMLTHHLSRHTHFGEIFNCPHHPRHAALGAASTTFVLLRHIVPKVCLSQSGKNTYGVHPENATANAPGEAIVKLGIL
jgi:hypothetical protein